MERSLGPCEADRGIEGDDAFGASTQWRRTRIAWAAIPRVGGAGEGAHVDGRFACAVFGVAEVEDALGRIDRGGIERDALDPLGSPRGSRIQDGQGGAEVVGGEETGATAWIEDRVAEDRVVEDKAVEDGLIQRTVIKDRVIEGRVGQSLAIEGRAIPDRSSRSGISQGGAIRGGMDQSWVVQSRTIAGRSSMDRVGQSLTIQSRIA
ncbi:hypothetical protein [Actinokineospora xionganensis]|uniref:DUF2382 domain-containing protein n=1 Tax=Actinokineospora xionganensis TaxID=2684470 RepID=A0ABR7L0R8_9PSEU|nr:hypothetical protein [Actinokineospora xionganensis]MBC6446244.1 hypothetical protein [Actinokineospora xionganensis]